MIYATEQIAHTLRSARKARGLSQRALGAKAGVPQSHISKIENGTVDLRLSSLVELARVLDLELTLVPRKAIPAVHAIVRSSTRPGLSAVESNRQTLDELKRLQDTVLRAMQVRPAITELAQLQRQARELQHFPIPSRYLEAIRNATDAVKAFHDGIKNPSTLQDSLMTLRDLRNALAHTPRTDRDVEMVRPAYSLDEDDHG